MRPYFTVSNNISDSQRPSQLFQLIPSQGQDFLEGTAIVPEGNPLFSATLDSNFCIEPPIDERGQRLATV